MAKCGQLYVALDAGYLDDETFQNLYRLSQETGKVIGGLLVSVKAQRDAEKR